MELLVECAVRGTSIAAAAGVVLWVGRIRTPAVLHGIWTSVVVAMLMLPLWTALGPNAPVSVLPAGPQPSAIVAGAPRAMAAARVPPTEGRPSDVDRAMRVHDSLPDTRLAASAGDWSWPQLVLLAYGLVACVLLVRLAVGTLRAHNLVRRSVLRAGRLTNAACASPVTVGWLRPVVILPENWEGWTHSKLDAVLAHEHEHLRRRDPLVQWLALLNRALFWFHPLTWWLQRRLAALAEQACDDAVLARGHDPRDYSAYLLETAHAVSRRARVNLAGAFMPGVFLPQRIRRILDGVPTGSVSRVRMTCVAGACALTSLVGVVATPVRAASQQAPAPSRLVFRPLQPRWIPPESTRPQPVSLEWLDGDEWAFQVQSIITDEELVGYSRLRTAPERDAFIARFWADRDPTPDTPANEFQAEYTRRVQFGIERFASTSGQAGFGFDTDRGRIYLMLGDPDEIETEGTGDDRSEIWRYDSVTGLGSDFRIRFALARSQCGHQILSPSPIRTIETVGVSSQVGEPMRHATVRIYAHGLTAISVPLDAPRMAGARYELRNGQGVQVEQGQIGWLEDGASSELLSQHLPPSWLAAGLGVCTYSLPANRYTLSTVVRFVAGERHSETVTFDVP